MALGKAILESDVPVIIDFLDKNSIAIICEQEDFDCSEGLVQGLSNEQIELKKRGMFTKIIQ